MVDYILMAVTDRDHGASQYRQPRWCLKRSTFAASPAPPASPAQAAIEKSHPSDLPALQAAVVYVDKDSDEKIMPQMAKAGEKPFSH